MSDSLESMGTTFIKLGQFLATRPDIIGEELTKNLEKLQDKLPPFSSVIAIKIIEEETGKKIDEIVMTETAKRIADARATDEGKEGTNAFLDKIKPGWQKND